MAVTRGAHGAGRVDTVGASNGGAAARSVGVGAAGATHLVVRARPAQPGGPREVPGEVPADLSCSAASAGAEGAGSSRGRGEAGGAAAAHRRLAVESDASAAAVAVSPQEAVGVELQQLLPSSRGDRRGAGRAKGADGRRDRAGPSVDAGGGRIAHRGRGGGAIGRGRQASRPRRAAPRGDYLALHGLASHVEEWSESERAAHCRANAASGVLIEITGTTMAMVGARNAATGASTTTTSSGRPAATDRQRRWRPPPTPAATVARGRAGRPLERP